MANPRSPKAPRRPSRFVLGLLVLAPLGVTAWALGTVFGLVDGVLGRYAAPHIPFPLPGLGLLLLLTLVYGAGWLSTLPGVSGLLVRLDRVLRRVPLASWIYDTTTQIAHYSLNGHGTSFERCVLAPFPGGGSYALGFVSGPAPPAFRQRLECPGMVAVFIPTTPNPTSGFTLYLPESDLVDTGLSNETGFRLILTAGALQVSDPASAREALREVLARFRH
jgi:uncharacterized membrane protein